MPGTASVVEVVVICAMPGMERSDISIVSDSFLDGSSTSEKPNLQLELLRKLVADEMHTLQRTTRVQARLFSDSAVNHMPALVQVSSGSRNTREFLAGVVDHRWQERDQ